MKYFLCGDNDFLIDRRLDELVGQFAAEYPDGEVITISVDEQSAANIASQLIAMSLLASHQCFIIRGVTGSSELWSLLETVLPQVPTTNTVIMTHLGEVAVVKNYATTKTYKSFTSSEVVVEKFAKPRRFEINSWIKQELSRRGIKFQSAAVNVLAEVANGYDNPQQAISSEIDKLALLGVELTPALVDQYAFRIDEANVFTVFDLAMTGCDDAVITEVQSIQSSGNDPYQFMGLIASQLSVAVSIAYGAKISASPYQLDNAKKLINKLGGAAIGQQKLARAAQLLAEADRKIKLSKPEDAWTIIATTLAAI